jgi:uncharacterized protein with von Willebrand factor type A (vWA) domain
MDDMEKFKKLLGPLAKEYNEAQLLQLRREMREMADLLLDIYLWRKRGKATNRAFDDFMPKL